MREEIHELLRENEEHSNDEPVLNKYNEWVVPEIDVIHKKLEKIKEEIGEEQFNRIVDEFY